MSYYPQNPQSPLNYQSPYQPMYPSRPMRPQAITVLSVLCIVFGSLGLLGNLCGVIPYAVDFGAPNPFVDYIKKNEGLMMWTIASLAIGSIMSLIGLVGGIGGLSLKPWARVSMLIYAVVMIIFGIADSIVTVGWLMPALDQTMPKSGNPALQGMMQGMVVGLVVGALARFVLPICILIFMNKPHVKAAFAGQLGQYGGPMPGQYQPPYSGPGYYGR